MILLIGWYTYVISFSLGITGEFIECALLAPAQGSASIIKCFRLLHAGRAEMPAHFAAFYNFRLGICVNELSSTWYFISSQYTILSIFGFDFSDIFGAFGFDIRQQPILYIFGTVGKFRICMCYFPAASHGFSPRGFWTCRRLPVPTEQYHAFSHGIRLLHRLNEDNTPLTPHWCHAFAAGFLFRLEAYTVLI